MGVIIRNYIPYWIVLGNHSKKFNLSKIWNLLLPKTEVVYLTFYAIITEYHFFQEFQSNKQWSISSQWKYGLWPKLNTPGHSIVDVLAVRSRPSFFVCFLNVVSLYGNQIPRYVGDCDTGVSDFYQQAPKISTLGPRANFFFSLGWWNFVCRDQKYYFSL